MKIHTPERFARLHAVDAVVSQVEVICYFFAVIPRVASHSARCLGHDAL